MLVYLVTNKINGKRYVGQTRKSLALRWRQHCKPSTKGASIGISGAIKKYGKDSFTIEVLGTYASLDELNAAETKFIVKYDSLVPAGYNIDTGGDSHVCNERTRKLISAAALGKRRSPQTEIKKGQRLSPSTEFKKGMLGPKRKQVIDLTTGFVWDSMTEAAHAYGRGISWMHWHIKHAVRNKRFAYVEAA